MRGHNIYYVGTEFQIRGSIQDNSKIFFFQQKHYCDHSLHLNEMVLMMVPNIHFKGVI